MTMQYLTEGISKLRAVEVSHKGRHHGHTETIDLWRGMRNVRVPDEFMSAGGTMHAPMSTSLDVHVAVQYAMSEHPLLLKLVTKSFMQRGANMKPFSCFPSEREMLFSPMTFLRPTGSVAHLRFEEGVTITVVEVEPHCG